MMSVSASVAILNSLSGSGPRFRRAVADLVRNAVHARRGISRHTLCNWIEQFIGRDVQAMAAVFDVIDTLCEFRDIGQGFQHGEPVLFALPERRVTLPDGRIVALGDHGISTCAAPEMLFPVTDTGSGATLIDFLSSIDCMALPEGVKPLSASGCRAGPIDMPPPLRRALTLCAVFDPATGEWAMSQENAAFLNAWFGLAGPSEDTGAGSASDTSQQRVTETPASSRIIVTAGPGAGKTHVACERVVRLAQEDGLAPARILVLSFTRVAVAELKARIAAAGSDVSGLAAVQIRTFDSFAARLLSSAGVTVSGDFDAGIRAANRLLASGDPLVANAIRQLEHVIIDEAQDLTGDRSSLCRSLIALLHPDCGVTVFGDPAQSIYGFQRSAGEATFFADVAGGDDFRRDCLEQDHRTRTPGLREMFRTVRQELLENSLGSREDYFRIREKIRAAALEDNITGFSTHHSTVRGLILTRSRRALISAAEIMRAAGRRFRLRLPERPLRIEPWIGAVLGGLAASVYISRPAFEALYESLVPAPGRSAEDCWRILTDLDGSGRDTITVGRVAEALEEPPLELVSDYEGSAGPLLSTIHAVKGGEDRRVMLLLTRAPQGDEVDWGEEARALYVGATRASEELRTGWISPVKLFTAGSGKSERYWAPRADHRILEIGLEGDLMEWRDFVRAGYGTDARRITDAIWTAGLSEGQGRAVADGSGRLVVYSDASGETPLGCISDSFCQLLQQLRQAAPETSPPERLSGFSIVGATTAVVPGQPGDRPSLALMPLLGGFARVPR